jgi:hypothetical protein
MSSDMESMADLRWNRLHPVYVSQSSKLGQIINFLVVISN